MSADMYFPYILASYLLAGVVLSALTVHTVQRYRKARRLLRDASGDKT